MSAYGVPFGSYGNAEHPDYYADDPTPDGKCPCDSDMYATGDCPIHDTRPQPPGFCACGSPWCDDPTHNPPTPHHTPPQGHGNP